MIEERRLKIINIEVLWRKRGAEYGWQRGARSVGVTGGCLIQQGQGTSSHKVVFTHRPAGIREPHSLPGASCPKRGNKCLGQEGRCWVSPRTGSSVWARGCRPVEEGKVRGGACVCVCTWDAGYRPSDVGWEALGFTLRRKGRHWRVLGTDMVERVLFHYCHVLSPRSDDQQK